MDLCAGCYAEFVAVPISNLATMPASLTFEEAAGVPLTALTAWQVCILQQGHLSLIQHDQRMAETWQLAI